jgi:hypothetical protein
VITPQSMPWDLTSYSTLKTWKLLSKLRCCPQRATALTQAILVLQHLEDVRH